MNLPEVEGPKEKRLSFKEKLKWTGIILTIFFILGIIPLFGLGENALQNFEFLSLILGAEFGSIISLGIGPLVTASIILQLLNGSGIVKFDLTTDNGKRRFQGVQKLMALFFLQLYLGVLLHVLLLVLIFVEHLLQLESCSYVFLFFLWFYTKYL